MIRHTNEATPPAPTGNDRPRVHVDYNAPPANLLPLLELLRKLSAPGRDQGDADRPGVPDPADRRELDALLRSSTKQPRKGRGIYDRSE